ncbi:hypothetical protein V6N13_069822 [Hibiscus sabdariffa]|uniref:Uncharacterized protein n=2 Tax=Hibiscus sabdariffa TaxID=183260 RepID=A0ABR2BIQ8_9ROSI
MLHPTTPFQYCFMILKRRIKYHHIFKDLAKAFSIAGDIQRFQSPKVKDCVVQERNTLAAFQANTKVEVVISFLKLLLHSIRIAVEQVGRLPRTDIFCEVDQYPMTSKNSRIIDTWHKL